MKSALPPRGSWRGLPLALLLLAGCAPPGPAPPAPPAPAGPPPAEPSPAPGPSAAQAPEWQPQGDEAPRTPASVTVRFVLEPQSDGQRILSLSLEGLKIKRRLALVPPEHRCGVEPEQGKPSASVGCGMREIASVARSGNELTLHPTGEALVSFEIGDETEVVFLPSIVDPASGKGCGPAQGAPRPMSVKAELGPGRKVEIGPGYRWAPRTLVMSVPDMQIKQEVTAIEGASCRGHLDLRTSTYEAGCNSGNGMFSLLARADGDALLFTRHYIGGLLGALGGFRMPCGVAPRFEPFSYTSPGFGPPSVACRLRCDDRQLPCLDRCDLESRGASSETSQGCHAQCRYSLEICNQKCPP